MSLADIAYKAADIISERGHCKNLLEDEEGRVCLAGALNAASCGEAQTFIFPGDVTAILEEAGDTLAGRGFASRDSSGLRDLPVIYNNLDETSPEDVILLLKETGKKLEEAC